ncbi:MAG: Lsr2 dimerization domain-containing protein, partial [Acidimicrobiales bacterium]
MARITKIVLTCDVDGDDTVAEETVRFGLDGREYEIELCSRHHKELNGFMRTYVESGRKVDGGSAPRRRRARTAPAGSGSGAATRPAAPVAGRSGA